MKRFAVVALWLALVLPPGARAAPPNEVADYARHADLTTEEASVRLDRQERATDIVEALQRAEGSKYAGVWFDASSGHFKVPVVPGLPAAGDDAIRQVLLDRTLASVSDIVPVKYTWVELEATLARIRPKLEGQTARTGIYTPDNRVRVTTTDAAATRAALGNEDVEVREDDASQIETRFEACSFPNCSRPLRGGVYVESDNGLAACSAGPFMILNYAPYVRLLELAGHCFLPTGNDPNSPYKAWWAFNPTSKWTVGSRWSSYLGPDGDDGVTGIPSRAEWIANQTVDPGFVPWNTGTYWSAIRSSGWSYVGLNVCMAGAGANTVRSCGWVQEIASEPTCPNGVPQQWCPVGVQTYATQTCSWPGDSGAPVRSGGTVWGILTQGPTDTATCGSSPHDQGFLLYNEQKRAELRYNASTATGPFYTAYGSY
jgi:hypothetical protein